MNCCRDLARGWGGEVVCFPELVGEPYASDLEIPRAQAGASGNHRLETRPGCMLPGTGGWGRH